MISSNNTPESEFQSYYKNLSHIYNQYSINKYTLNYTKEYQTKKKNVSKLGLVKNKQKINFITFGGPSKKYHERVDKLVDQAHTFDIFDNKFGFTDTDLKKDILFWDKHGKFIIDNERGFGFWIWKSYIILKILSQINYNDIIIYADAGCYLIIKHKKRLYDYFNILENSDYGLLVFDFPDIEKKYNKGDLLKYFQQLGYDKFDMEKIKNSNQIIATYMIIKKNNHSMAFVGKWYELCSHYNLINDSPSTEPNDTLFLDHRHDQAIFSLLVKTYGAEILPGEYNVIKPARDRG
jgi:hypothetical protein